MKVIYITVGIEYFEVDLFFMLFHSKPHFICPLIYKVYWNMSTNFYNTDGL